MPSANLKYERYSPSTVTPLSSQIHRLVVPGIEIRFYLAVSVYPVGVQMHSGAGTYINGGMVSRIGTNGEILSTCYDLSNLLCASNNSLCTGYFSVLHPHKYASSSIKQHIDWLPI